MEYDQKLADLLNSHEKVNIKLAYSIFVESGRMNFIDFIRHGFIGSVNRIQLDDGEGKLYIMLIANGTTDYILNIYDSKNHKDYEFTTDYNYQGISSSWYKLTKSTRTNPGFSLYVNIIKSFCFLEAVTLNSDKIHKAFKKWMN